MDLSMPGRSNTSRPTEPLPAAAVRAMFRLERTLAAPGEALAAKVCAALGLHHSWKPCPEFGETATRFCVWSVRELQDVYARVGGTVTAQQVERTLSDGDRYTITEVTVTVDIPDVGSVQVFTDWDPADEGYGYDLPVIRTAAAVAVA